MTLETLRKYVGKSRSLLTHRKAAGLPSRNYRSRGSRSGTTCSGRRNGSGPEAWKLGGQAISIGWGGRHCSRYVAR